MNRDKLKSKKVIIPLTLVGLFIVGGSASLMLDVFGNVEGDGSVNQSVILSDDGVEDGTLTYSLDEETLNAGDITTQNFSIENRADTPVTISYSNYVEVTDTEENTYNSTNLPESNTEFSDINDIVQLRIPDRVNVTSETDDEIQSVNPDTTFAELVSNPTYVAYNVVNSDFEGVQISVDLENSDENSDEVTMTGNGSEGLNVVDLSSKEGIDSDLDQYGSESVSNITFSIEGDSGQFELLDLTVNGLDEYPSEYNLNGELIPSDTTVTRTQSSVIDTYLAEGVSISLQTDIEPQRTGE